MRKISLYLIWISLLMLMLSGCKVTNQLKDNEYMHVRNEIELDKTNTGLRNLNFDQDDLPALIQLKPNKKFLGLVRLGEMFYADNTREDLSRLRLWMNKSFGKNPAILDEFLVDRSMSQLSLYLDNHGFFNSFVDKEITIKRKKATVSYAIKLTKPYYINNIEYIIQDTSISNLVLDYREQSLIQTGQIYNATLLDDERYRITHLLRDHGYFYFSPEFVFYEVDSAFGNHTLKLFVNIQQAMMASDTNTAELKEVNHRKYHINQIAINTDFNPIRSDTSNMRIFRDTISENGYNRFLFYYRDNLRIRPSIIRNSIFLNPGSLYSRSREENTYRQLSSLSLYGYTALQFRPANEWDELPDPDLHHLDALINLSRRPVQSFSIETEGTTSGGDLGLAANFVYQNLNIFKGAEVLTLKLTTGFEWQQGGATREDVFLFFNTIRTGAEASIDFPKFVLPISQEKLPDVIRPRTTVKVGVNYQNRPDYMRYVTNAAFGYSWRIGRHVSHILNPIELNSVSIFPDSSFVQRLEELNDPRLSNQYTDQFIMSAKYIFIFNNQEREMLKNFTYLRWSIETAGNLLKLINNTTGGATNEDGDATVWNIPFAQYVRTEFDYRYYFVMGEDNMLVTRGFAGIGVPYNNSKVLPFEKGFYGGGANDMRGWEYRSLGPGSFQDTSSIYYEKMGDITFKANLEYRFPIYSYLKGALFTDIGNIWLLNLSENYPGGHFKVDDFLSEFAFDAGIGLRLDFSFFIFRVDGAAPIKNPSFPKGDRWRIKTLTLNDLIWNFGIGYPF